LPSGRTLETPELSEVYRELKAVMEQGFKDLRADLRELDKTYLREKLYDAEQRARDAEIQVLRQAIETNDKELNNRINSVEAERTANKRLALAALVFPTLLIFITYILPRILTP